MSAGTDAIGPAEAMARIEQLLADAERLVDPQARALARSLAASLIDLVGAALTRVVEVGGPDVAAKLAADDLVGNLFVLCGMHPETAALRARRALERSPKQLASLGVVLEGVDELLGGIRVRVTAERGAVADPAKVRALIESLVMSRAPDVEAIQLELGGKPVTQAGFVSVERLKVIGA
jgi:hypothetical protein